MTSTPRRLVPIREHEETLPQRLERLRIDAGYASQAALARAMGSSPALIGRHFLGIAIPSESTAEGYARLLGCSVEYLLTGREDEPLPPAVEQYLASARGRSTRPEVAMRLRRITWSALTAGPVDEKDVHTIRQLIDANLARRASSADGQDGRSSPARSRSLPDGDGSENKRRGRKRTASAQT